MVRRPPGATVLPYTTRFRSQLFLGKANDFLLVDAKPMGIRACKVTWRPVGKEVVVVQADEICSEKNGSLARLPVNDPDKQTQLDRQSTRLNSSHANISYAVL